MNENSNVPARVANVKLTKAILMEPSTLSEMLSIPAIEQRWVDTYEKISGKPDGQLRFEAEKVLFTQAIASSKAFDKCDRFTVYASFIELAISGLTLRDGLSYIIPYGDKAQFQPGWKGRLEQINELPNVIHVQEPQVVYDCDHFDYEKGMKTIIHSHKPASPRPADAKIMHVYLVIQFDHGLEVYMMDREDVEAIRDNYSSSYKAYMKALKSDVNKGKKPGDKLTIQYKKDGQMKTFESEDVPMWVSSEAQAYKKTLVKRTYGSLPKLPKHKALDDKLAEFFKENPTVQPIEPEDQNITAEQPEINIHNLTNLDDNVDPDTGEVTDYVDVTNEGKTAENFTPAKPVETDKQRKAREKKATKVEKVEGVEEAKIDESTTDFEPIPEDGF